MRVLRPRVIFLLAITAILTGAKPSQPAPRPEELALRSLELKVARLEGTTEGLKGQLETERAIADHTLSSVQTVILWGTLLIAILGSLAAVLGYRDLRKRVDERIDEELSKLLEGKLAAYVDPELKEKLREWDARLNSLLRRAERLSKPGTDQ
jgi:hypothetical protein